MKRGKKVAGGIALAAILAVAPAWTAFAEFHASYNSKNQSVIVSGTTMTEKVTVITIGKEKNGLPTIVEAVKTDGNGSYKDFVILLPSDLTGGKYYVSGGNEAELQSFMYIDETDEVSIAGCLTGLDAAVLDSGKTARDLEDYLTSQAENLAIDLELLAVYATELSDLLFLNYPEEGIDQADDFTDYYYQSLALAKIAKGENISQTIKSYGIYFQFDAEGIYNALSDKAKVSLSKQLSGSALFEEKAEICFKKSALMAQIDTAETWEMLRETILGVDKDGKVINDNFTILNPDTEDYDDLSDKNAVFEELYRVKNSMKNLDDVKDMFESAAEEQYLAENPEEDDPPGFGGGGGGGVAIGGYNDMKADASIQLTEEDAVDRNLNVPELKDIAGHWAQKDIQALCQDGLLKGYEDGRFEPDNHITRAEFAVLLSRAFSLTAKTESLTFSDVSPEDWYYAGVMEAMRAGIIYGSDGRFEPNQPISRQDMCVMLYRAIGAKDAIKPEFADEETIAEYAKDAVGYLAQSGLVNGMGENRFAPLETATRAEVAAILNRYLHQEG